MMLIIILLSFTIITAISYCIISYLESQKRKSKLYIKEVPLYKKIEGYTNVVLKKQLIKTKYKITPVTIFALMIIFFLIAVFLFNILIQIPSTAFILSLPFLLFPIIFIKVAINREKREILRQLPMYIINLKNHVSEENNIIKAIQITNVDEPLSKYIQDFKINVSRGMNVIEAFEILKSELEIKSMDGLIDSCETCYLSGGDFTNVLEQYLNIITKENRDKEETREKAYSDILTLLIMVLLNVFVIVFFVFGNKEYAYIIRETSLGRVILNFNALSYMLIGYLVSKIYKED